MDRPTFLLVRDGLVEALGGGAGVEVVREEVFVTGLEGEGGG